MKYFIFVFLFLFALPVSESFAQKKKAVSFSKEIMPLIEKNCLPCHAAVDENPGKFFMEDYKAVMTDGKHGKAVIAGKSGESNLVNKLKANPPFGEQMPLMRKTKLTNEEIDLIANWIDQGAKKN